MVAYSCHPALGRLQQEDFEFKASGDNTVRLCIKTSQEVESFPSLDLGRQDVRKHSTEA